MRIWAGVLNISAIGVTDNFFELGGDSIKAVQISSRLYEEGIEVTVKDILTYHTIEHTSRRANRVSGLHSSVQEFAEGLFAPTPVQRWFFSQRFENPNYYNQSVLLAIRRPLDLSLLGRTFKVLIEHHDTLRVNYNPVKHSFFYNNEHLNEDPVIQEFEIRDDRPLSNICNEIRRSLHIQNGLLMKMAIIRKPGEKEFLFITAHHLIMDGISWRIFLEDFHRAYIAIEAGNAPGLPPKTASFKDWSAFVNELSASPAMEEERGYWKEMQTTAFRLPVDLHPGVKATKAVRSAAIRIDRETTAFLLKDAHKPYNTDVPILLNCALVLTLNKWTGSTEFVIEQESHGRPPDGLNVSRTIGWFTSIYPLKLEYKEEKDLLIRSVKEKMRKVSHNGIGYAICTSPQHPPEPTDIRLNYLGEFGAELNNTLFIFVPDANGTEFDPQNAPTAKLEFNAMVIGGDFQLEIIYASALFNEFTIGELAQRFSKNLTDILSYLENEDEQHFTPSDFSAAALDEDELKLLFSGG
jgi:non-ribosomal peptide synthase protein (TIGR01720 family)